MLYHGDAHVGADLLELLYLYPASAPDVAPAEQRLQPPRHHRHQHQHS